MKLNKKQTEQIVSIVNYLIEAYCNKYPDQYNFDDQSIGYDPESLEIVSLNGDDLEDTLDWVIDEILPEVVKY